MEQKKVISISIVLTILIILFGNNWLPRFWGFVFKEKNIVSNTIIKDEIIPVINKDDDSVFDSELSLSNLEYDTVIGINTIQNDKENIIEKNDQLDLSKDYTIDDLEFAIYENEHAFVKKYLNKREEYLKLLNQDQLNNLKRTISLNEKYGISNAYYGTVNNMIITVKDDMYGFLSNNEERIWNEIIDPIEIEPLIYISKNEMWGVMNENGEILIPIEYEEYDSFYEDVFFFAMKKYDNYYLFDKKGNTVNENFYDQIRRVSNEHMIVEKDKKMGLIDLKGELVIPVVYDSIITDLDQDSQYAAYKLGESVCYNKYLKRVQCI